MIPPGILQKPDRLDMEEFTEVKKHPVNGAKLLRRIDCGTDLPMIVAFDRTLSIMKQGRGTEFEPRLFDRFLEIVS